MIDGRSIGRLEDGTEIFVYTLKNSTGAYAEIATLGGCLISLYVPDKHGALGDVLLGYNTLETLQAGRGYMGMLIGRYGNRIGGASFTLNGKTYALAKNDGENHLHGGVKGFDKQVWAAEVKADALVLRLHSPDGDEGYPGALDVKVTYTFSDDCVLGIHYEATCDEDTILNLTNHAYFNLSGPENPSIGEHEIQIHADAITEVGDRACIPTGRLYLVDQTPFDLRKPRAIGEGLSHQAEDVQMQYGNGYDHNYIVKDWNGRIQKICTVTDPVSGRKMETWTDQPGVQFYSGNSISGDVPGKAGVPYQMRQGFCLETQHFPDTVHHPSFPTCVLRKGKTYDTVTEYRFSMR